MNENDFDVYFDSLKVWQLKHTIHGWLESNDLVSMYVHHNIDAIPGTDVSVALIEDHKRLVAALKTIQKTLKEIARRSDASVICANPGGEVKALLSALDDIHKLATNSELVEKDE